MEAKQTFKKQDKSLDNMHITHLQVLLQYLVSKILKVTPKLVKQDQDPCLQIFGVRKSCLILPVTHSLCLCLWFSHRIAGRDLGSLSWTGFGSWGMVNSGEVGKPNRVGEYRAIRKQQEEAEYSPPPPTHTNKATIQIKKINREGKKQRSDLL